ncbi:hypothetical protein [Bacillus infantis]|uniref:hypothetical protein n=1 Tax=Bacillus infantis TaxID=324767 RepID=UPI00209D539B|nr:hypothetical protein [Bacillus infantis]MCP1158475.1 hypothetical protein [Bacillus infantis]
MDKRPGTSADIPKAGPVYVAKKSAEQFLPRIFIRHSYPNIFLSKAGWQLRLAQTDS